MGVGEETILSDHRPIYLHISLSKFQKGRGFWRLNGDFLTEPEYVFGCNNVNERVIFQYSERQSLDDSPELPDQEPASRSLLISHILLLDVLLLEVRAYSLKYAANLKKKMLNKTEELNDLIKKKANSNEQDDIEMVEVLKQEVQEIEDKRDMGIAMKHFAKVQLEGEKPLRFFCNLNKKRLAKAQFKELHIVEKDSEGREKV